MSFARPALLLLVCAALLTNSVRAQTAPPTWSLARQFSADQVVINKEGASATVKMYVDNGKMRIETATGGMSVVAILLTEERKMYAFVATQRTVMEKPLNDGQVQKALASLGEGGSKSVLVGPDTVDGTACTEYRVITSIDPKPLYWWIDTATKAPVKMTADDGSTIVHWKNYKAGPQDPLLFQPPAGYPITQMPADTETPGSTPPISQ
jgi:hypothetical protein